MTRPTDKRVLILGATGMLGNYLAKVLSGNFEVLAPKPRTSHSKRYLNKINWLSQSLNVNNLESLNSLVAEAHPDVIINCVAITPDNKMYGNHISCLRVNSLFPHYLEKAIRNYGCHLIHISTDGVFSGKQGNYSESDLPDPPDLYGRSKLLGEVTGKSCLTIRTTFFGSSPTRQGMVEWLLSLRDRKIKGYRNYIFTGLSLATLAKAIILIIRRPIPLTGLYHVGGPEISKYHLLVALSEKLQLGTEVEAVEFPVVNRSLDSSAFRKDMQMELPSLDRMVDDIKHELAADGLL